jgi:FxsC-like protein
MIGHSFFFSYARDDYNPFLNSFLEDLAERVRGKAGLGKNSEIYFRDESDIELGQQWQPSLESALQHSKTMLCMYSPRYFQRPVCGVEMQAFIERQAALADAERLFLLPVIWIPCESCIPKSISSITFHHADFPASHKEKGLEVLTRQATSPRYQADYEQCLEAIATKIVNAAGHNPPLAAGSFTFNQLKSAFEDPVAFSVALPAQESLKGPDAVDFVYIAGTQQELATKTTRTYYGTARGDEWRPFSAVTLKISALASKIAALKDFSPNNLRLSKKITDYLAEAETDNRILVLFVDPWTLNTVAQYESQVSEFAKVASLHTSIIVIWNEGDPDIPPKEPALKAQLIKSLKAQITREEIFYRPSIRTTIDLETALSESLIRIQDRIIQIQKASELVNESSLRQKPELGNMPAR